MLILLPTATTKLQARWQGLYKIIKPVGEVNYLVRLHGRRKKQGVYHVNMLCKEHTPQSDNYYMQEVPNNKEDEEIPTWKDDGGSTPLFGYQLDNKH